MRSYAKQLRRSLVQFRTHPLRTFLALLGMVLGVSSVVAMRSIGEGAQREILASIESLGDDVLHVKAKDIPEGKVAELVNRSAGLSRNDAVALGKATGAAQTAYVRWLNLPVSDLPTADYQLQVGAVSAGVFALHHLELAGGRTLLDLDERASRRVAVLGAEVARSAFGESALGRRVRLGYAYFEVVGVLAPKKGGVGLPLDAERYNRAVLVPYQTALEELAPSDPYRELDWLSLRVGGLAETVTAKRAAVPLLKSLHGGVEDVEVVAPEEVLKKKQAAQGILNVVLTAIAAISLLVGGIGVMNIMLANVMERIGEIGLRRAVGASRADIRRQFLLESVTVCLVGGAVGVVLGLLVTAAVGRLFALEVAFAWSAIAISFLLSTVVGLTFGLWPAVRASQVSPVEALSHS